MTTLYQHSEQSAHVTEHSPGPSVSRSVGQSVHKVYWAKRLIGSRCHLGWVGWGCIRWGCLSSKGRGSFCGEFGVSHCNQWGLCCLFVRKCVNRSSCCLVWWVGSPRHSCIRWGPRASRGRGGFSVVCPRWPIGFNGVFCNRNLFDSCEKLIIFPYGQYIVGI